MVWHRLKSWLSSIFKRQPAETDLQRELQSHIDLEAEEQREYGLPAEEAHYAARRAFGNPTLIAEDVRGSWNLAWLEHFFRDLRHGARSLLGSPSFSAVAVLTLALGIGANTAIFSTIDALMLRPLPFSSPDQIVRIYSITSGITDTFSNPDGPSAPDVRDFEQKSHSFQKMVIYDTWRKNVTFVDSASEPEQMRVGLVPAAYFEILDVKPIAGRLFAEDENQAGRNFVAAISSHLWRNRFGGDPAVLGRKIRINGEPYAIVAVMPDVPPERVEAGMVDATDLWTPLTSSDVWAETSRGERGYLA